MNNPPFSDSPTNLTEYTVSEISGSIKRTVESAFGRVRLRGEVSGYRGPHASGHAYFALKDERARIEAVIWRGAFSKLKFKPEEGMEMIATGKVTTYPGSSKYQIVIEELEPAGAGALMALLEERRKKLAGEGLFDEERKKRLPFMPRVIGVVTSPTGAVIRDILHRITDRFPVRVIVWPVRVQGETSGDEVATAISGFNALPPDGPVARPDLLIVARGGGSLEDLWGFNDEAVVRAAAASTIPLISAVGHETDWTLIDHAADRRAPTPTGAAEIAVPVKADLTAELASLAARLQAATSRRLDQRRQGLRALARALPSLDAVLAMPRRRFDEVAARLGRGFAANYRQRQAVFQQAAVRLTPTTLAANLRQHRQSLRELAMRAGRQIERRTESGRNQLQRWDDALGRQPRRIRVRVGHGRERAAALAGRIDAAIALRLERRRRAVQSAERLLNSMSYMSVLNRGYALVHDAENGLVSSAASLPAGSAISIQFADGQVRAVTRDGDGKPARSRKTAAAASEKGDTASPRPKQGSLF